MIWFTIALFAASFILTALLTPKPELENARPSTFDDVDFPRATEDAPIPLILGKVLMDAPNTIWYGDFRAIPITKKVKTGLFSSTYQTIGHTYILGFDLALALGPGVVLTQIQMDDKELWSGSTNSSGPTLITLDKPSLFGGRENGGGFTGGATYYPGDFGVTQPPNYYMESILGAGAVPAYRGTAHMVFQGCVIGEQASLRKMAFVLECYTNDLGGLPNDAKIGEDMNPAEAIYQIFTSDWRGADISLDDIDLTALRAFGTTLYNEGNGVSIKATSANSSDTLVKEILRQVDGIAYQDPDTGKIIFDLIREDYVVSALDTYDEDDIKAVTNFTRTAWDEVITHVKVSYPQRDGESNRVAESHDMATANMLGRQKTTTLSMPFCYDDDTANSIASRERAQVSVPLISATLEMLRSAYSLRPGSVFKMDWPEYGVYNMVMRVKEFDLGALLDGRIVIKVIQDNFAAASVVFASPANSSWEEPETTPVDATVLELVELPQFFNNKMLYPVEDGMGLVFPLVAAPTAGSTGFDAAFTTTEDVYDARDLTYVAFPTNDTILADYGKMEGFQYGLDSTTGILVSSSFFAEGESEAVIQEGEVGLLYMNGEWMAFLDIIDNGDDTYTLWRVYRGLLGTTPRDHTTGDRIWQPVPNLYGDASRDDIPNDATVYGAIMVRVGAVSQDETEAATASVALEGIADSPLRPRFLKIEGGRSVTVSGNDDVSLTFLSSNRNMELIAVEDDAAETPSETEVYDVDVFINGVKNNNLSSVDNASSPVTIPFNTYTQSDTLDAEVRVRARRSSDDAVSEWAFLPFTINNTALLTSGDMQSGSDKYLTSGDAQSGDDVILVNGDEI